MDLDSPAGDADCLEDEPEEALAAVEVELVEGGGDPLAEVGDSVAQPVLGGELGAACGECLAFVHELAVAGGERAGTSGELVEVEQTGLVGVKQSCALGLFGVDDGVQALELGGDQLVLVGRAGEHGALAGEELLWVKQSLAYLLEHILVELVGADVALRTESVF